MKERPILFSAPMVRAILEGRKTQARRAVKFEHANDVDAWSFAPESGLWRMGVMEAGVTADMGGIRCPYGAPGDQLWVRETHYRFGHWEPKEKASKKTGRVGYRFVADSTETRFEAPAGARVSPPRTDDERERPQWYKRLARFMPRASSRTLLEVVSVRVERLNAITEEDAKAEGVALVYGRDVPAAMGGNVETWCDYLEPDGWLTSATSSFASLWRSINGADSWAANPWVWVVEFRVLP